MVKKRLHKYGFTLVELMLVTTMLAVIGVAVYGTFTNGINIWKTVTQESANEDINILFEKISTDLRNAFKFTGLRFRGAKNKVSFPAVIKRSGDEGIGHSIGEVTYAYDRRRKTVNKRELTYSEAYQNKPGVERVLTEKIGALRFKYFVFEPEKKKYSWVTSWQEQDLTLGRQVEENLPLIVRVEVDIPADFGKRTYVRNVAVPSACCWPFEDDEI